MTGLFFGGGLLASGVESGTGPGLDRSDVNQIGMVLGEAGIAFDVGADGTSVLVAAGTTAQSRMLLDEKGMPTSSNAGYGKISFAVNQK